MNRLQYVCFLDYDEGECNTLMYLSTTTVMQDKEQYLVATFSVFCYILFCG